MKVKEFLKNNYFIARQPALFKNGFLY